MASTVPKLGLSKIGIKPNEANQRRSAKTNNTPSRSRSNSSSTNTNSLRSASKPASPAARSPRKSAPRVASTKSSISVSRASVASSRSAPLSSPLVSSNRPPARSLRRESIRLPAERANPACTNSPRRTKPVPVRGARPGALGAKRDNQPPPLWKVMAEKGKDISLTKSSTLSEHKPRVNGARSAYETDMHHHIRRVAAARTTIDNKHSMGVAMSPKARYSLATSLKRTQRISHRSPSVASSATSSMTSGSGERIHTTRSKAIKEDHSRTATWVDQLFETTDASQSKFSVGKAGVDSANGIYCFDRETRHGPSFRKESDRRWKLAKGGIVSEGDKVKFDKDCLSCGGWYIYNISDWRAVYRLICADNDQTSDTFTSERMKMWPPSRAGWESTDATDGPAPIVSLLTKTDHGDQTSNTRDKSTAPPTLRLSTDLNAETTNGWTVECSQKISRNDTVTNESETQRNMFPKQKSDTLTFAEDNDFSADTDRTLTPTSIKNMHSFYESVDAAPLTNETLPMSQVQFPESVHIAKSPRIVVSTATIDKNLQHENSVELDGSGMTGIDSAPQSPNGTFSMAEIATPETGAMLSSTADTSQLLLDSIVKPLNSIDLSSPKQSSPSDDRDILKLKHKFSDLAIKEDINSKQGLNQLAESLIKDEARFKDELGETCPSAAKMREVLYEMIERMTS